MAAAPCLSVFAAPVHMTGTARAASRLMQRRAVAGGAYCARMDDGGEGMMMPRRRCLVVPAGTITMAGAGGVSLRSAAKGPSAATDLSLDIERANVRVAYQGSPGTATEEMVLKSFPDCIPVPCKKFVAAFEAVNSSLADIVVLPIENSSTGSFHQNYDLLLDHKLHTVQEFQVDIELCLWALPGVQKNDLRTIFSHPEELAQCEHSLSSLTVVKENVDHCAAGAEIISMQNLGDAGVIGSAQAAELYGLNIVECDFQIESRPNKREPMRTQGTEKHFNYIFYVDFEASTSEARVQNALKDLKY
ncbi:hypothetical protein E2562_028605 [Oryza meyeriana var. granulata]|uniref:Prephenate dehydratase domain-containing protein n=1 Tax=Oryza meyeriana var. granulata TaxID=110450 RepID=A0A6G1DAN0_9ORYZ|nr:hypothetical protein E2562_028605 [Oryza meyeriana var. granulata]